MKIEVQLEESDVRVTVVAQSLSFDANAWMTEPVARERLKATIDNAVRAWVEDCAPKPLQPQKSPLVCDFEVAPV